MSEVDALTHMSRLYDQARLDGSHVTRIIINGKVVEQIIS